jgi:hypothetical protein
MSMSVSLVRSVGLSFAVVCAVSTLACGRVPLDDPSRAAPAGSTGSGGSVGSAGSAGTGSGGGAVTGTGGATGRVPAVHRPTADRCPLVESTSVPCGTVAGGSCKSDGDCTGGTDGRCVLSLPFGCLCAYDACFVDADCVSGTICACNSYSGNSCVTGNCHVDSDCGAGGFCSPVVDGCSSQVLAYACHTAKDTCSDNKDCPFGASCAPDPSTKAWGCGPANGCPL